MKNFPNMPTSEFENRLADAIFKAEGGENSNHPYGIHGKFDQSPREICINTIRHQWDNWAQCGRKGEFIAFLGAHYAPEGAENDPDGLNSNWVKNVNYFMDKNNSQTA